MSKYLIRVYQTQILRGCADVFVQAASPEEAGRILLEAAQGDPDDDTGERRYRLPDGTRFHLDPEDEVVGGDIWTEVVGAPAPTVIEAP